MTAEEIAEIFPNLKIIKSQAPKIIVTITSLGRRATQKIGGNRPIRHTFFGCVMIKAIH
jgi:hypothetical protein